jgi:tetratricopeptide (TPR) repeat protein
MGTMRLIRLLVAMAIVATAAITVYRGPVQRYRCNLDKRRAATMVDTAMKAPSEYERVELGRHAIDLANQWLERYPADYELYITRGGGEEAAGMKERALQSYRQAYALNQRPEVLLYMALVQFDQGQPEAAMVNITKAATFNLAVTRFVDPATKELLDQAAHDREERLTAAARAKGRS